MYVLASVSSRCTCKLTTTFSVIAPTQFPHCTVRLPYLDKVAVSSTRCSSRRAKTGRTIREHLLDLASIGRAGSWRCLR